MNTYLETLIFTFGKVPPGLRKETARAVIHEYVDSHRPVYTQPPESIKGRLCSVAEYAAQTHTYQMKVLRMIKRGDLVATKIGKTWVIIT